MQLNDLLTQLEKQLQSLIPADTSPKELYEPIRYGLAAGGKRIRPMLCLLAYGMYKTDVGLALPAAQALEVFHNFTLLHDDIMDNADVRRNRPTVCKAFGQNAAILSGDAMLIRAYKLLEGYDAKHLPALFKLFNTVAEEVCQGQQYDINFEALEVVSTEAYLEMIRLKTAVLPARAMQMGALIADASPADIQTLYELGIDFGLAFQMQDDYLDLYGDIKTFGKAIGQDIIDRKKTYLFTLAWEKATEQQRAELTEIYKSDSLTRDEKIQRIQYLYEALSIRQSTEETITKLYDQAIARLQALQVVNTNYKTMLIDMLQQLIGRNK